MTTNSRQSAGRHYQATGSKKVAYTLATKSTSTRSILLKSTESTAWTKSTVVILAVTKSTQLNMFNFGGKIDRISDKVDFVVETGDGVDSVDFIANTGEKVEVGFVASVNAA